MLKSQVEDFEVVVAKKDEESAVLLKSEITDTGE